MKKRDKQRTEIVITSGYRWSYFEWFLLGFYQLQRTGEVALYFDVPFFSKLMTMIDSKFICRGLNAIPKRKFEEDSYHMSGYMIFPNGSRKTFTIDSADSPYLFGSKLLQERDVYFKMQCPINLEAPDFALTDEIHVPWIDFEHEDESIKKLTAHGQRKELKCLPEYKEKIKPLMIGPKRLSPSLTYGALKRGYENYVQAYNADKTGKLMCYFGNAFGPKPEYRSVPDFDSEATIMGFYGDQIAHPNEKRAKVAKYIGAIPNCDARVIGSSHSDSGEGKDASKIIPLEQFCAHVAKFQYNFNVSGYRKSIPNRFIESFLAGTAIVSDQLCVKWYRPFEKHEVIETVPMGYLRMDQVDWKTFERDLQSLPETEPERIRASFNEKWRPDVVARYIIQTVREA